MGFLFGAYGVLFALVAFLAVIKVIELIVWLEDNWHKIGDISLVNLLSVFALFAVIMTGLVYIFS